MKVAVQALPEKAGINLANWNWKVVRRFVQERFGRSLSLPGYSPDFNADEAIGDWAREEITANLCLGTKAVVQEKLGNFFAQLAERTEEVKQRCRTVLQTRAEALPRAAQAISDHAIHVDSTWALV